jgi:alanine dehydrogenase
MPGAVAQTSTWALTNTTIAYAEKIATNGLVRALRSDPALALGVNTYAGHVTYGPVAQAHGMSTESLSKLLPLS